MNEKYTECLWCSTNKKADRNKCCSKKCGNLRRKYNDESKMEYISPFLLNPFDHIDIKRNFLRNVKESSLRKRICKSAGCKEVIDYSERMGKVYCAKSCMDRDRSRIKKEENIKKSFKTTPVYKGKAVEVTPPPVGRDKEKDLNRKAFIGAIIVLGIMIIVAVLLTLPVHPVQ